MKTIYAIKFEDLKVLEYWMSVCIMRFPGNNTYNFFSEVQLNASNLLDK